jgi:RHS repeat-associated protein
VRRHRARGLVVFISAVVTLSGANPVSVVARPQAPPAQGPSQKPLATPSCDPGDDITASAELYSHFTASGSLPPDTIRDGNESTNPGLTAPHVEDRFWRYAFPAGTTISTYRIHQVPWSGNTSTHYYIVSSASIEGPWTVRGEHLGEEDTGLVSIAPTTDLVWRIYSVAGNNGWGVFEWRMFTGGNSNCIPTEQLFGVCMYGHQHCPVNYEFEPVNTAIGNYVLSTTDLALPGRGVGVQFARTYNSLDSATGALGIGWRHAYEARLVINPDGTVRFIAEDGAQLLFVPDGQGGFNAPGGVLSALSAVGGGYQLLRHDQMRYSFDAVGTLTAIRDRNANQLAFSYASGKLTQITDTVGRIVSLTYNASNRLETVTGPQAQTVTFGYDANGRLASVIDVRDKTTTYTYEAGGRLATIVDPNNHTVVTNEYGPDGRVSVQTDARGKTGTFDWDDSTETSTFTDARGGTWVDDYDANVLQSSTDPMLLTTSYTYDGGLNVTSLTDPRSFVTAFTYDTASNRLTRTAPAPLSYTETWTYSARNDVATYRDGRNNVTTYGYDTAGNLTSIGAPLGAITELGRDPAGTGLLVSVTDARDKTTTFGYDPEANLDRITTPLGNVTTMTYDDAGRMLTRVEPRGNVAGGNPLQYTTTSTYDAAGNLLTNTDALSNTTTRTYDDVGNLQTVTDAKQHSTTYAYDEANHVASVTDAKDGITAYTYDNVGSLATRTDAKLHVTTYGHDLAKRLTSMTAPLNRTWTLGYDAAGNLTNRVDANQNTVTYEYDALNRLSAVHYNDQLTPDATFGYDANDNRTTVVDAFGTDIYVYDALNRLSSVTRGSDSFSYGYDLAGNLTSRTYPGQAAQTLSYDDDGRVSSAATTSYTYDPSANVLTATTPDSLTARNTYDRTGRLVETVHTRSSGTLSRFTYSLDAVGNRTAMTTRQGTVTYRYDELDRLTEACWSPTSCPGGSPAAPLACLACVGGLLSRPAASVNPPPGETYRTYAYDAVSNRQTEVSNSGTTTYAYDDADRLTTVDPPGAGATTYAFDANGNQTAAGATTFTYDRADRLRTAVVGSTTETYTYWGDGTRRSASTGSQANKTTRFVWDRNQALPQVALERNGSDSLLRAYTYGLDLVSQKAGSKTFYYHHDGLGSVADVTGNTGTSLLWSEYYPYGLARQSATATGAPTNPFNFSGEQRDPTTGLYHLRARQFDATTGRFLTTDPAMSLISDPYLASYVYARNNPVNRVDPFGLASEASPTSTTQPTPSPAEWTPMPVPQQPVNWTPRTYKGCDLINAGFGLGMIVVGVAFGVVAGYVEVQSVGTMTVPAAAALMSGTADVVTGVALIATAC